MRLGLKLPTGKAADLIGSGGTDLSLRLAYSDTETLAAHDLSLFGSLGAVILGSGKVLPEVQRHLVGFGSVGLGWQMWENVLLKMQIDGHTPFYNSNLDELGGVSAQLVIGGSIRVSEESTIDLAISEDIVVDTAPDVVFHLSWCSTF